ncbi:MAG: GNA1162 family protein [Pseudomonadota bacterium]
MKTVFKKITGVLLPPFIAIMISGCVVATQGTVILPRISTLYEGTYKVDPYMEKHRPRTIAVLPFFDRSRSKHGFETVRRGFYNHFSSLPFKDMELYRIDDLLKKAGLTDPEEINKTSPQKLGEILGVDAVVYGEISDFDKLFAVIYSQVSVGAEVKMVDAKTGNFLWSGQHVARIHEGGLSVTPVGIVATVIVAAMNMRDIQLLRACDDLFREMVKTIPVPSLAEALRPPEIFLLVQDTQNRPRKAGDEIRVVMQGTSKMRASFDIGEFRKRIDMHEQDSDPGVYLGIYRVVPGDNLAGALITGRLMDDAGNSAEWVDAIGTVTLDTIPPAKPTQLRIVGRDRLVLLTWEKSAAADLSGYRLYRSQTPLSGYQEIAKTEFSEHRDQGLDNGRRYYYQVSAVDRAGNESEKSEPASGMPVAPGPTPVEGAIEADTTWYAGASPYVIEKEVIVRDKAVLTIEPGTEIHSRGGALVIEGRLQAQGDGEHLILFDAAEGAERWAGIRFANVREKENLLRFVRIRKATAGIACENSSPRIEESELTENATAIAIRGAFSAPAVAGNTLHKNGETAVFISDGAKPTLSGNRIHDNAAEGVVIRSASPVILRNAIMKNRGGGVAVSGAQVSLTENSLTDNGPFDLAGEMTGEPVVALTNWWGTVRGIEIFARIRGRIDVGTILSAPYPAGKPVALPILASPLSGPLKSDGFLILSHSPYRVMGDVTVDGGAVLHIEPGVVLQYDRNTSIIVEDGGIAARGTPEQPIVFTASGASPAPGSYGSAVRFTKRTQVNSVFSHCVVKYATTAFDIYYGTPEISFCHIASNAQSGIYVRNDAAPQISYSTFEDNLGEGAIKCVGISNPSISYNNFLRNAVSVQGFSSIYIDARHNWWGASPPDPGMIWGDPDKSINIKPWLTVPEEKAFPGGK